MARIFVVTNQNSRECKTKVNAKIFLILKACNTKSALTEVGIVKFALFIHCFSTNVKLVSCHTRK